MRETLLETAERGDLPLLVERLAAAQKNFISSIMDIDDQLIDEALWYARAGDLEEAKLRLRLRIRPKWHSEDECKAAYKKAMAAKRARAA
jgi:hypothetical protein